MTSSIIGKNFSINVTETKLNKNNGEKLKTKGIIIDDFALIKLSQVNWEGKVNMKFDGTK